jgi:hypothetical protein
MDLHLNENLSSKFDDIINEVDSMAQSMAIFDIRNAKINENIFDLSQIIQIGSQEIKVTRRAYKIASHMIDLVNIHGYDTTRDAFEMDVSLIRQVFALLKREILDANNKTNALEAALVAGG